MSAVIPMPGIRVKDRIIKTANPETMVVFFI